MALHFSVTATMNVLLRGLFLKHKQSTGVGKNAAAHAL